MTYILCKQLNCLHNIPIAQELPLNSPNRTEGTCEKLVVVVGANTSNCEDYIEIPTKPRINIEA
jgi:hypothetical protein